MYKHMNAMSNRGLPAENPVIECFKRYIFAVFTEIILATILGCAVSLPKESAEEYIDAAVSIPSQIQLTGRRAGTQESRHVSG